MQGRQFHEIWVPKVTLCPWTISYGPFTLFYTYITLMGYKGRFCDQVHLKIQHLWTPLMWWIAQSSAQEVWSPCFQFLLQCLLCRLLSCEIAQIWNGWKAGTQNGMIRGCRMRSSNDISYRQPRRFNEIHELWESCVGWGEGRWSKWSTGWRIWRCYNIVDALLNPFGSPKSKTLNPKPSGREVRVFTNCSMLLWFWQWRRTSASRGTLWLPLQKSRLEIVLETVLLRHLYKPLVDLSVAILALVWYGGHPLCRCEISLENLLAKEGVTCSAPMLYRRLHLMTSKQGNSSSTFPLLFLWSLCFFNPNFTKSMCWNGLLCLCLKAC